MSFNRFWDITADLKNGMVVWPGDVPFERKVRKTEKGEQVWSNSWMSLGCHTGTHMDAPRHVFENGVDINSIPLATLIGDCYVIEVEGDTIEKKHVYSCNPQPGDRAIFKTSNCARHSDKFEENFVYFSKGAAEALVQTQVALVGTDGPSVDPYKAEEYPAHTAFCEAGVAVLENLKLDGVEAGHYTLICLPMKIDGADGAPVRAILAR